MKIKLTLIKIKKISIIYKFCFLFKTNKNNSFFLISNGLQILIQNSCPKTAEHLLTSHIPRMTCLLGRSHNILSYDARELDALDMCIAAVAFISHWSIYCQKNAIHFFFSNNF